MEPTTQTTEAQETNPTQIEVPLSDGRTAIVRKGKGGDFINAVRMTDNQNEYGAIVAASVTTISGKSLHYDEFLDLDIGDFMAILNASNTFLGKSLSPAMNTLST